jgi:hypothetical protein
MGNQKFLCMFRGIPQNLLPAVAVVSMVMSTFVLTPTVSAQNANSIANANPNYFYERETAFVINNTLDYTNGGMYVAVDKDGTKITNNIPESVWGYPNSTIPGVSKSHIGQATCIRYLITEYQRTNINGVQGVNSLVTNPTNKVSNATGLLEKAQLCADFVIDKFVIPKADNVEENPFDEVSTADQGDVDSPNKLFYWGVVDEEGDGGFFDDTASGNALGVSRSESSVAWSIAELGLAMKKAGFAEADYAPYRDHAINYMNWRKTVTSNGAVYEGNSFDTFSGRDFFYPNIGFALTEITGDTKYRDGDGTNNADNTAYGAIPFLNQHLGTADAPNLGNQATNPLQESAYIAGYGRGVPFTKHSQQQLGDVTARDQWWEFGQSPHIVQSGSEYAVRETTDPFFSDEILSTPFAHFRGRELLAGIQRSLWFSYTNGVNPNIYYQAGNSNPANLSTNELGQKTVEYWDFINGNLWDNTSGQAAWLEAKGHDYKPCFSGGNDVPIGDWQAPEIGDKVHTLNTDNSALVTVSGVTDLDTPYMSWNFSASGVREVEVDYTTDNGATWTTLDATFDGTNFVATIPKVSEGTTVYYYAKAVDNFRNWTAFPSGAETWDNAGNSLGKSIENSQTYTIPAFASGVTGPEVDPNPSVDPVTPPVLFGGAAPDAVVTTGGGVGASALIRTGGY